MVAGTSASQSQGRAVEDENVYTRLRRSFDRLGMAPEKANATRPSTAASNAAKPIMTPAAARPWHGCASTPSHVLESWRAAVVMRAPSSLVCKSLDFVRRSMPDFAIHRTAIARAKHDRRGGSDSVICKRPRLASGFSDVPNVSATCGHRSGLLAQNHLRWPSYEGIEVKLRFPVSGELRLWRQVTPLPTSYPVGFAIPDHDPGIREREFQAAVPI